ncbi:vitamin K epoxide reductase family protein [Nanoarchaeota archaeon]
MKYQLLLALFIISLVASAILSFVPSAPCPIGEEGGCNLVQESEYASTFGIKNYFGGVLIFLYLTYLTFSQIKYPRKYKRRIINSGVIVGALIGIYFLYLQEFVLNAYCTYCLVVDFAMLIALVITLSRWRS